MNCGKCEVKRFQTQLGRVEEAGKLRIRVQWTQGDLERVKWCKITDLEELGTRKMNLDKEEGLNRAEECEAKGIGS